MTFVDLDCRQLGRDSLAANEVETISSGYHQRGRDQSEDLVSLDELLRGAWSAQAPTPAGQSEISLPECSAGDGGHTAMENCQEGLNHGSRRGTDRKTPILLDDNFAEDGDTQDPEREADSRSEVHGHDGSASVEQGVQQGPPNTSVISAPGPEVRDSAFPETEQSSLADAPPPLPPPPPPPSDTVLSSISDTQAESTDGALIEVGLRRSDKGKEKVETGDAYNRDGDRRDGGRTAKGATGVAGVRDSSKRTAGNADLNEGGEDMPRSEKVRRTDPTDGIDDADENISDLGFARLRALPKPVFRIPPSWRDFQQREITVSSSQSSGAGDNQDDPFVIDDNGGKAGGSGPSTRATSVELETETAYLLSSLRREELKTLGGSNGPPNPDPPTEPLDRPTSPDVPPPQHSDGRVVGEDEHGAAAAASPPSASPPPLAQQPEARTSILEEEEREISKIVGKRRAGKGDEYRVRWKSTWLPRSDLGNAKRLLKEFEARHRARRGGKRGRLAHVD